MIFFIVERIVAPFGFVVPCSSKPQFTAIRAKFGQTIVNIRRVFTMCDVPLDDMMEFLQYSYPHLVAQANHCESIKDVFALIVRDQCTVIDINILEVIVDMLVPEAKRFIDEYNLHIEKFCKEISIALALEERFKLPDHTICLQCETALLFWTGNLMNMS